MSDTPAPFINVPIPGSSGTPRLNCALAKAQGEFAPIIKSKTVTVQGKDGRSGYTFIYAELSDVIAATMPSLSKNEIAVSMPFETSGNNMRICVQLRHSSGEMISTALPFTIPHGRPQELGSLLSFYRRYLLSALLNVASEDDDDGNAASGQVAHVEKKPAAIKKPAAVAKVKGTELDDIRSWVYPFETPKGMRGIALADIGIDGILQAGKYLGEWKSEAAKNKGLFPEEAEKFLVGLRKILQSPKKG